ncbi:MAG: hypothetical protein Kapaf2KO_07850 [Candidatus Kapaibacteriales bacterium]
MPQFRTSTEGNTLTIYCPENLLGGQEGQDFTNILSDAKIATEKIVVDLTNVKVINSSGVGMLVGGFTSSKKKGIEFLLTGVSENVMSILKMTHLDKVFVIK